jgi:hypothetical protein
MAAAFRSTVQGAVSLRAYPLSCAGRGASAVTPLTRISILFEKVFSLDGFLGISAFTRVFDALGPAMTVGNPA